MSKNAHETVKDLTLILLYLTSWKDKELQDFREDVRTAWKGYDFDVLNELTDENLINGSGQRKKSAEAAGFSRINHEKYFDFEIARRRN